MEEQLDELEEQLREQRLEDLIFEQERREASEAMQEQLEAMTTDGRYVPSPPPQEGRRHRNDGYCVSSLPLEDLSPTPSSHLVCVLKSFVL